MNTYLLTWNPKKLRWNHNEYDIQKNIDEIKKKGKAESIWSCGQRKYAEKGDSIFLMRLGEEPRGIVGSGFVAKDGTEVNPSPTDHNKTANFMRIYFDCLLDPDKDKILSWEILKNHSVLKNYNWTPEGSGNIINSDLLPHLEQAWDEVCSQAGLILSKVLLEIEKSPNELDEIDQIKFPEGSIKKITVNNYERSGQARKKCIDYHGRNCKICGFNFESKYGCEPFIHVHHKISISEMNPGYKIDPIKDLIPLCPNCHAVVHKRKPPYTIEEVKGMLKNNLR